MSFRACSYFHPVGVPIEKATGFRSERVDTHEEADDLLEALLALPGKFFVGGHVEQHVPGVGWVLVDEVESTIICKRRAEADLVSNEG